MDVSYLLLLLLAGTLLTYLSGDRLAGKVALLFGIASFALTLSFWNSLSGGASLDCQFAWITSPKISFALKGDGLAVAMLLLNTALTPLITWMTFGNEVRNARAFYALLLFMSFAMAGTFLASDGLLYYIFWELALIPIYFIALLWGDGDAEQRRKAVVKFFIYTFAGSLFMLTAFVYLYTKTGSLLLDDLYKVTLSADEQLWIFLGFFLAYAIKIPLIPFHTWQATVYQKAPTAGTILLSGIMLKMGLYSVIRWQLPIAPLAAKEHMPWFLVLGIGGVVYGSIVALRQKDLKRLLAYSSLAHVGLIAAGTYTLTLDGLRGAVLQMLAHGFVVAGLFFAAEIIYRRYQTRAIAEMGGIRVQATSFASLFMIMVLASVALPSTFNFIGEFTVLYSLFQINMWYAIVGGLTIILGAYYMLKMFQQVMLGERHEKPFAGLSMSESGVLVVIVVVIFAFGVYPKPLNDLITPALENILTQINRFN
ncbi:MULTISPECIES: NuoM family protein [unclassified Flavobacterium]|uniref:complex I subunit 4 family protein n=1 Tax=unclassified Flavobacterium TaxID=196869 RepID=UPI001F13AAE5|nr:MULTISPECIES: NADH-quinone oxidoreductase subunit M [unclassified Flavobacterium]UMY65968.1 NADH-quinone oxidoreductase subunit M [Flavobacterium sp. HJ-32-4]